MKNLKMEKRSEALVIVAHPDDETIWAGGTMIKNPEVKWTIFSLCRASDINRAPKFKRVCDFYNAKSIMMDLDDDNQLSIEETLPIIEQLITENIGDKEFDYIFTHGENGEYKHPRHIGAHKVVKRMVKEKKLKAKKIFYFDYKKNLDLEKVPPYFFKGENANFSTKLTKEEWEQKKDVMVSLYGFDPNGIDANYCTNPEYFYFED